MSKRFNFDGTVEEEEVRKVGEMNEKKENGKFLKGLFEDRMMSIMKIRTSLEKVVEDQKREELVYKDYIHKTLNEERHDQFEAFSGFSQNEVALLQNRISELEEKHHQEFERRVKLQKAFLNFKTEGNSIIDRLRFALRQVGSKYKKERLKNRHLTKRLNEQLLHPEGIGEDEKFRKLKQLLQATSNELQKYKVQFHRVEEKFVSYKRMVVDHKKVIASLRKKLDRSEEENEHLRKQTLTHRTETKQKKPTHPFMSSPSPGRPNIIDELSPMVGQHRLKNSSDEEGDDDDDDDDEDSYSDEEDVEEEDIELKHRLKKFGVEHNNNNNNNLENDILTKKKKKKKNPNELVKDQQELIKKLLDRLETEEDQRLKTEEQSYKIVEEEERTISFLESQIQSLTNNSLLNDDGDDDLEGISPMKNTLQ